MKKPIRSILRLILIVIALIQLVPVKRDHSSGESRLTLPDEIATVLEQSCFDCHSGETNWPWYGRIAPVSWLITRHVNEARSHLDFSEWDNLPAGRKEHLLHEIGEEVEEGKMPLRSYLLLHSDASLTEEDREGIHRGTDGHGEGEGDEGEEDHE